MNSAFFSIRYEVMLLIGLIIMALFLLIIVTFSWVHQKKKGKEESIAYKNKLEAFKKSTVFRIQKEEEKRFQFSHLLLDENRRIDSVISLLQTLSSDSPDEMEQKKETAIGLLSCIQSKIQYFSMQTAPAKLIEDGLYAALSELCAYLQEAVKVDIYLKSADYNRQNELIEIAMYRIAEEVIQNAIQHGKPNRIDVQLGSSGGSVFLEISDNGFPFNLANALQNEKLILNGVGLRAIEGRMQNGFELQYDHCNGMNQNTFVYKDY